MTEERALYTTDEVMQMRVRIELQRKQLDELRIANRQLDERLDKALRTIGGFSDAGNQHWDSQNRRIKELEATVARLEADNKRLRTLDAMPLDALRRYWVNSEWDENYLDVYLDGCSADFDAINGWFASVTVTHD